MATRNTKRHKKTNGTRPSKPVPLFVRLRVFCGHSENCLFSPSELATMTIQILQHPTSVPSVSSVVDKKAPGPEELHTLQQDVVSRHSTPAHTN